MSALQETLSEKRKKTANGTGEPPVQGTTGVEAGLAASATDGKSDEDADSGRPSATPGATTEGVVSGPADVGDTAEAAPAAGPDQGVVNRAGPAGAPAGSNSATTRNGGGTSDAAKNHGGPAASGRPLSGGTKASATPNQDLSSMLGQATWVMMHSPLHKHLFLQDLDWLLVPPIAMKQFRLWRRDNLPVAFASWAFLSPEVEERFKGGLEAGTRRLAPADWRSGENLWLIDLVCPFGGREEAMQQLKNETFKGRKVKTLQVAPGGHGMAVMEW